MVRAVSCAVTCLGILDFACVRSIIGVSGEDYGPSLEENCLSVLPAHLAGKCPHWQAEVVLGESAN